MQDTQELSDEEEYIADDMTPALPWWKRPLIMGLDILWLGGIAVILVLAAVYLLQRQLGETVPSDNAFSDVVMETARPATTGTPSPPTTEAPQPDMSQLTSDLKAELDARDKTFHDSLAMMQDSISRIAEALRRDEGYAQETRQQVSALQTALSGIQTKSATSGLSTPAPTARKKASAVSGMKVVSMESGMAWVRWQGSTWAVREGDVLGKVTITRIDPGTRTLHTSGGIVR